MWHQSRPRLFVGLWRSAVHLLAGRCMAVNQGHSTSSDTTSSPTPGQRVAVCQHPGWQSALYRSVLCSSSMTKMSLAFFKFNFILGFVNFNGPVLVSGLIYKYIQPPQQSHIFTWTMQIVFFFFFCPFLASASLQMSHAGPFKKQAALTDFSAAYLCSGFDVVFG